MVLTLHFKNWNIFFKNKISKKWKPLYSNIRNSHQTLKQFVWIQIWPLIIYIRIPVFYIRKMILILWLLFALWDIHKSKLVAIILFC
jgi:hypothetical protein